MTRVNTSAAGPLPHRPPVARAGLSAMPASSPAVREIFAAALQHQQAGRWQEASRLYRQILVFDPSHTDSLHRLGLITHQLGHPLLGISLVRQAVALNPAEPSYHLNLANLLMRQGQHDEAVACYWIALNLWPDSIEALNNCGTLLRDLGRPAEALEYYDRALALAPSLAEVHNNRGVALKDLNRPVEALASYETALAFKPSYVEALNNRGNALRQLTRLAEALASYDKALALRPDFAEALNNRASTLRDMGRLAAARADYDRALALRPDYLDALNNRGSTLRDLGHAAAALADYDRALMLRPDHAEVLNNRAAALRDLDRADEAVQCYDRALALAPGYADAWCNKGIVLNEIGRFSEANAAIEAAIRLVPTNARFYYNLNLTKKLRADDPHLLAMRRLAQNMAAFGPEGQIYLHFALGKALADLNDHEASFGHFLHGNALKRSQIAYDEAATFANFASSQAAFTNDLIRTYQCAGEPSRTPVFILGMPRSGSTLVEQILASHPQVFGAGEIDDFEKAMADCNGAATSEPHPSQAAPPTLHLQLRQLGSSYLARIRTMAPTADRIINKTPENFRFLGLIHLSLPNARIIHTRRDAVDTCLSCFTHLFVSGLSFTYDLAELGHYYRGYEALMAHWRSVLPSDVMLDLDYEQLVADPEAQARRIVAHCGLQWDPRCLDFHQTPRAVRTASTAQVRQPVYKTATGRRRTIEPFLEPLLAALGPR